jgi:hypothetical protein
MVGAWALLVGLELQQALTSIDTWGGAGCFCTDQIARETTFHPTEADGVPTSQARSGAVDV